MHRITHRSSLRALALTMSMALLTGVAACGGDDKAAETTPPTEVTAAPTTTDRPTTTATPTTKPPATTTTAAATTTTTIPKPPVYPLTGVLVSDPAIAARPALIVKIDNANSARPQTGFNSADIVVEEIVNDNLTRFAMVFQSGDSDPVGPVRSGRLQDIDLFTALNHPLFAWSGGNKTVTEAINNSELVNLGPSKARVYYRASDRRAPHNLYTSTEKVRTMTPEGAGPPPQQFAYRDNDEAPAGVAMPSVAITLDSIDVVWKWDAPNGLYRREMEGKIHEDRASGQITTNNVVVLAMEYKPGISNSPDAHTIGSGEAHVFTGGNYVHGTWARADIHDPFTLTDDDGKTIELQPGRTFIELPRADVPVEMPAE